MDESPATTYTTHPINPDLDALPTGTFEITAHPTLLDTVLLHNPYGRLISIISKPRLCKLSNIYQPQDTTISFPEAQTDVILQQNTTTYRETFTKEWKLHKQHKKKQHLEDEKPWHIPDTLFDALCNCFQIKRVIHCSPTTLPLRAKEYISHDPKDANFGAIPYTKTVWPDASLALPSYKVERLTKALEQTLYIAHTHRHT